MFWFRKPVSLSLCVAMHTSATECSSSHFVLPLVFQAEPMDKGEGQGKLKCLADNIRGGVGQLAPGDRWRAAELGRVEHSRPLAQCCVLTVHIQGQWHWVCLSLPTPVFLWPEWFNPAFIQRKCAMRTVTAAVVLLSSIEICIGF